MKRYAYLWGTKGTTYCELGRDERLDDFLRSINAVNPAIALQETLKMLGGFFVLPGYGEQEHRPVAVRYSPMHLYKRVDALKSMEPFAAISINGLEQGALDQRECYYTYLVLMDRETLLQAGEHNYLDHIFGTKIFTAQDELDYKNGELSLRYATQPMKEMPYLNTRDLNAVFLTVVAMYSGMDWRVVIRTERGADFMARAWKLLKQIYSLMPPRMAAETGFSVYERPENIRTMSEHVNTRIFVIPAECDLDERKHLPEQTILIDLADEAPRFDDPAFQTALSQWCGLSWEIRQSAMAFYFNSKTEYFKRNYYISVTKTFFEQLSEFERWRQEEEQSYDCDDNLNRQLEFVRGLHRLYERFPICKIPCYQAQFAAHISKLLPTGIDLRTLRTSLIRMLANPSYEEYEQECMQYYQWLSKLDHTDILMDASQAVYKDEYIQGEQRKENAVKEKTDKMQGEIDQARREWETEKQELQNAADGEKQKLQEQIEKLQADLEGAEKKQREAVAEETQRMRGIMDAKQKESQAEYETLEQKLDKERLSWESEKEKLKEDLQSAEDRKTDAVNQEKKYWQDQVSDLKNQLETERECRKKAEDDVQKKDKELQKSLAKKHTLQLSNIPKKKIAVVSGEWKKKYNELKKNYDELEIQNQSLRNENHNLKERTDQFKKADLPFFNLPFDIKYMIGAAAIVVALVVAIFAVGRLVNANSQERSGIVVSTVSMQEELTTENESSEEKASAAETESEITDDGSVVQVLYRKPCIQ